MDRQGGEYYGRGDLSPSHNNLEKRDIFSEGEVALWPDGNAFCIFFRPTPASTDERPRMISPGIPLGVIDEKDLSFLKGLSSTITVEIIK